MTRTNYAGIDYSLGRSNYDTDTGIHFGVISQNSVGSRLYDALELNYTARCPECVTELTDEQLTGDYEFKCPHCGAEICSDDITGDEPDSQTYDDGELQMELLENGELFIYKSPVVIRAQYCSPCFPGAGNLDSPCPDGPMTYALPLDWFERDNKYCTLPYDDVLPARNCFGIEHGRKLKRLRITRGMN